jgi:hypothetical protein
VWENSISAREMTGCGEAVGERTGIDAPRIRFGCG